MLNYGVNFLTVHEECEIEVDDDDDAVWAAPPADAYFPSAPCERFSATPSVSHNHHSRDDNACSHSLRFLSGLPLLRSFATAFLSDQLLLHSSTRRNHTTENGHQF